eukprot:GHRR01029008.1.p1 GENE.GHRR01029008.1~~GHRR01029008.1.p1  ORF type:complete len:155 (+),score=49.53 GHRR01029008.1:432-896(+)
MADVVTEEAADLAADPKPAAQLKPAKEKAPKQPKPQKEKKSQGGGKELKKETQLGLSTKKTDDFSKWYSELVVASELISYYDVSGCYILRPWAFSMWEVVQRWFDDRIKALGVQNAYFPMFITEDVLNTEKDHVEGFAPEVCNCSRPATAAAAA